MFLHSFHHRSGAYTLNGGCTYNSPTPSACRNATSAHASTMKHSFWLRHARRWSSKRVCANRSSMNFCATNRIHTSSFFQVQPTHDGTVVVQCQIPSWWLQADGRFSLWGGPSIDWTVIGARSTKQLYFQASNVCWSTWLMRRKDCSVVIACAWPRHRPISQWCSAPRAYVWPPGLPCRNEVKYPLDRALGLFRWHLCTTPQESWELLLYKVWKRPPIISRVTAPNSASTVSVSGSRYPSVKSRIGGMFCEQEGTAWRRLLWWSGSNIQACQRMRHHFHQGCPFCEDRLRKCHNTAQPPERPGRVKFSSWRWDCLRFAGSGLAFLLGLGDPDRKTKGQLGGSTTQKEEVQLQHHPREETERSSTASREGEKKATPPPRKRIGVQHPCWGRGWRSFLGFSVGLIYPSWRWDWLSFSFAFSPQRRRDQTRRKSILTRRRGGRTHRH